MINELLNKFKNYYNEYGDKIILDNIKLETGLYIKTDRKNNEYLLVEKEGKTVSVYILNDDLEKISIGTNIENIFGSPEEKLYNWFKLRWYCGMTKDSNGVLDGAKKIFSTNYLTFAMKPMHIKTLTGICNNEKAAYFSDEKEQIGKINKEMKVFEDIVNTYYNNLENLQIVKNKKILAQVQQNILNSEILKINLQTNKNEIQLNKEYILDNFKNILNKVNNTFTKNNEPINQYIHIFFEASDDQYIEEYKRYTIKSIFLDDKFNTILNGKFYALSRFNNSVNHDKPFFRNLSTCFNTNSKLTLEDLYYLNKFSEWLSKQKSILFINIEEEFKPVEYELKGEEYFLIKHIGEEITDYEYVCYKDNKKIVKHTNILEVIDGKTKEILPAKNITHGEMLHEINKVFFDYNLFKEKVFTKYVTIMNTYKYTIEDIYYKNHINNVDKILDTITMKTIKNRVQENNFYKIQDMLNLRLSLLQHYGKNMDKIYELLEGKIENAEEDILFQCGALIRLLDNARNQKNIYDNKFGRNIVVLKNIVNGKKFDEVKKLINKLYIQRSHAINLNDKTLNSLLNKINNQENFKINEKIDYLLLGYYKIEKCI